MRFMPRPTLPVRWDPRERAMRLLQKKIHDGDPRYLSVVSFLDEAALRRAGLTEPIAADGIYYHDTRQPFIVAAQTSITLATTDKLLYPGSMTALVANYFTPGKKVRLTVFGAFTTVATPGNLGVEHYFGTADAGGTLLGSSTAVALTANKTSFSAIIEANVSCRTTGPTGTVISWGRFMSDGAGLLTASASNPVLTPASVPAATTIDTTGASGYNIQVKRSGSTAETFVTHDLIFEALN